MMLIVPKADTNEKRAHTTGIPFTAHEFIEQAKKNYAEYAADGRSWKKHHREQRKYWKHKAEEIKHQYRRQARHENIWAETITGMLWFAGLMALSVVAYRHVPFFHYNFDRLGHWLTTKMNLPLSMQPSPDSATVRSRSLLNQTHRHTIRRQYPSCP